MDHETITGPTVRPPNKLPIAPPRNTDNDSPSRRRHASRLAAPARHGQLLTVEDAAEYLGIAAGTLRNWLSARRIAYVKVGRLTRLSTRDLDAFIAAHTVDAANADCGVAWDTESGDESL
jgi:excisionase family DNA binding protein